MSLKNNNNVCKRLAGPYPPPPPSHGGGVMRGWRGEGVGDTAFADAIKATSVLNIPGLSPVSAPLCEGSSLRITLPLVLIKPFCTN